MTKEDILEKFIIAGLVPSKYTIQTVLGFSAQTLVRRGFSMREIRVLYKQATTKNKVCPNCLVEFTNNINTYCSQSCAASVNNKKRKTYNHQLCKDSRNKEEIESCYSKLPEENKNVCLCCGKILLKSGAKYCSYRCQQRYKQNEYIERWLSGEIVDTTRGSTVSKRIRNYLFEKHNCKCSRCGWGEINPITGKSPLEVEHIDGNSENNNPDNLTLLCPNCHSLTPTYKALNKGKGRHQRMKRYKEGKSY